MATTMEYRHIGFIRSPSFQKVIGMFNPDGVVRIGGTREMLLDVEQMDAKCIENLEMCGMAIEPKKLHANDERTVYFHKRDQITRVYDLVYSGPALFRPQLVKSMLENTHTSDIVIDEIVYKFKNDWIIDHINEIVKETCKGKNVMKISHDEDIVATFKRNFDQELKKLDYLCDLQKFEVDNYGFKVAVLDLVDVHTTRVEKYQEKENLPLTREIIDVVLESLNWDGWPEHLRQVSGPDGLRPRKPCARRSYMLLERKGWVLQGQQELNHDDKK